MSTTQCGIGKKPGQDMPTEQISIAESNAVGSPCTSADQKSMPPSVEKDGTWNATECSESLTTVRRSTLVSRSNRGRGRFQWR